MFKRTILTAVTLSMLAVPMAQAQSRYDGPRLNHHYSQSHKPQAAKPRAAKPKAPKQAQKHMPQHHHARRSGPQRPHWTRGQRVPQWQHRHQVRDYQRHGLRKPAKGQHWVKIDNDYLLISLATGVILGMAAAR